MAYQKLQSSRAAVVVPSDTVNIFSPSELNPVAPFNAIGINNGCVLYVGGAGDVKVMTASGDVVEFQNVPAGTFMPVQVLRVYATGHTTAPATNIVALW